MPVVATNRYLPFLQGAQSVNAPPSKWMGPLVKSDTDEFPEVCKTILVLDTGDVSLVDVEGNITPFTVVSPGQYIVGFFKQLRATGTDATKVYAGV